MARYHLGDKKNRKIPNDHLRSPDTKFCSLFVMVLMLILTITVITGRRNLVNS